MKKAFTLKPQPVKRLGKSTVFRVHGYTLLIQKAKGKGFDGHYRDRDGDWLVCCHGANAARVETACIAWARAAMVKREKFLRGTGGAGMDEEE